MYKSYSIQTDLNGHRIVFDFLCTHVILQDKNKILSWEQLEDVGKLLSTYLKGEIKDVDDLLENINGSVLDLGECEDCEDLQERIKTSTEEIVKILQKLQEV